jgi:hypothetical protein
MLEHTFTNVKIIISLLLPNEVYNESTSQKIFKPYSYLRVVTTVFNKLPVHNKMHPHIKKPKLAHET